MLGGTLSRCFDNRGLSVCCDPSAKVQQPNVDFLVPAGEVRSRSAEPVDPSQLSTGSKLIISRDPHPGQRSGGMKISTRYADSEGYAETPRSDEYSLSHSSHPSHPSRYSPQGRSYPEAAGYGNRSSTGQRQLAGDMQGNELPYPAANHNDGQLFRELSSTSASAQYSEFRGAVASLEQRYVEQQQHHNMDERQPRPRSPHGTEREIQNLQMTIQALQSRLSQADAVAKHHEDQARNLMTTREIDTRVTDSAPVSSRVPEDVPHDAEERAVLLGLAVRQLEEEKERMREMLRSHYEMTALQADAMLADARRNNQYNPDQEFGFCAGPRRACG